MKPLITAMATVKAENSPGIRLMDMMAKMLNAFS